MATIGRLINYLYVDPAGFSKGLREAAIAAKRIDRALRRRMRKAKRKAR